MSRVLFRQVRRLDPDTGTDSIADWLWDSATGRAERAGDPAVRADRAIDGAGRLILAPTLCDLYVRSGEPGHEEREDLASLAAAAAAGGYSQVAILPDTEPPADDPAQVDFLRRHFPAGPVEALVLGAVSRNCAGEALAEVSSLLEAGVVGFTDARPLANWALLRRFLEYAAVLERPVLVWPCFAPLATGVALEGDWAIRLGLAGRPAQAESVALAGVLELVRLTGTAVHLMRISTARSVEMVAQAKAGGLPVTASATVHHLVHASPDLAEYDPNLRFEPPLGNPADRAALVAALEAGIIDAVASDHTPWTYEEKTLPFSQAPPGAIALELVLPLVWNLVREGQITPLRAWEALSSAPRRILALAHPLALVLFDPDKSWVPGTDTLHSRSLATAWLGRSVQGRVLEIF
ncbi:dihydroorotase [Gloeobacter morelensis]|uniref:Dihydroorotase n=1 Tax=Gloeobacter morelensis MG652769 TaxID=2781736 RepID=A0ABY3PQE0_9CYAN|nr:dihydroorotase [Gloeobacter morelensis]UFP95930.1 dihydroorotase [Gloeobacter morelensis MG652769]